MSEPSQEEEEEEQYPTGRCPLCGDYGWPEGEYCRYVYRWVRGEPLGYGCPVRNPPPPPPELVVRLKREEAR